LRYKVLRERAAVARSSITVGVERPMIHVSTPDQSFETAIDESSDDEAREEAIDRLETANECDVLAHIARSDDLAEQYRERALTGLAHPQRNSVLGDLPEGESLPDSLRERAESLLDETPDDSGAGP
jgi:hypothetical protein